MTRKAVLKTGKQQKRRYFSGFYIYCINAQYINHYEAAVKSPQNYLKSGAIQALAGHFAAYELKLLSHRISAGFPSPAADYAEDGLDLNQYLVENKPATFMFTVKGDSMLGAGICDGDKVVVDKAQSQNTGCRGGSR